MTVPTPTAAATLLAEADAAGRRVRQEADRAASGFLLTLGLASTGFFLAQPIAGSERGVAAAALPFALAVAGAAVALVVGRRSTRVGFSQRFGLAMGAWAAVFAVGLALGRTLPELATQWSWWGPLAALVAVPCLAGAWRELPR